MNFEEHAAKPLLAAAGIKVPPSTLATTPQETAQAAAELGPVVVKRKYRPANAARPAVSKRLMMAIRPAPPQQKSSACESANTG
jgi:hypothetical protein